MTEHAPQINQASDFDSTFERMCDVASIMEAGKSEQALRRLLQHCLLQQDEGYSNLDQLIGAINDKFGLRLPKYRVQASFDWLVTSHEVEYQEDKR